MWGDCVDGVNQARPPEPKRTRANILAAGMAVFAEHGYSGAKVSEIVTRANTTKPMIYYHFGSKQGLFAAVLEEVYAGMRGYERSVQTNGRPAREAMRDLVGATFDYHANHPDWVRLIADANLHRGRHIEHSPTIATRNSAILQIIGELLARGEQEGVFRAGVDPLHLHMLIASFSFYRVSNRHTWTVFFNRDVAAVSETARQREVLLESVMRFLAP